jgi:hypothetical protein
MGILNEKMFKEWKTWWGNSLDIVIPKSELVDEYNSIDFKGDENLTIFDKMKLIELRYKIGSIKFFTT